MLELGLANPGRWPAALRKHAIVTMLALGLGVSGATAAVAHDTQGNEPNTVANSAAQSLTRSLGLRDKYKGDPLVSTVFAPRAPNTLSDETFARLVTLFFF
jgi:hypothetical protein